MAPKVFKFVGSFFAMIGKGVWQAVKNLVTSDQVKAMLKTAQGKIVAAVVAELDATNLSSDEKRAEALKRIAAACKAEGLEFRESFVRLLLELAVARLKAAA